jgi:hypothetical protein
MYQARFSEHYQLMVQHGTEGRWIAVLRGPSEARDNCVSTWDIDDAKSGAYTFADKHFVSKGIAEIRVPRNELRWTSISS